MLTREECEKALDGLKEMIENCIGMRIEENEEFYIWVSTLSLIIKEHFENQPLKLEDKIVSLEETEELYGFLQGHKRAGLIIREMPNLTSKQAFAVIYYLQEIMHIIPDIYERCEKCGNLYDSDEEGICKDDGCYCDSNCADEIIKEHFDNPPLKFEELKNGMCIWDNKFKMYNEIVEIRINCANEQELEFRFSMNDEDKNEFFNDIYEKNRFYMREVVDER